VVILGDQLLLLYSTIQINVVVVVVVVCKVHVMAELVDSVWIFDLISIDFYDLFPCCLLIVLEEIYHTLKAVFDHI